jgi:hypothetical protein
MFPKAVKVHNPHARLGAGADRRSHGNPRVADQKYGRMLTINLDVKAAAHDCVTDRGNGVTMAYRIEIISPKEDVVEMADLLPLVPARALGGALHAKLGDSGLLDVDLSRQCRQTAAR